MIVHAQASLTFVTLALIVVIMLFKSSGWELLFRLLVKIDTVVIADSDCPPSPAHACYL